MFLQHKRFFISSHPVAERKKQAEELVQRWQNLDYACIMHHEKIRLLVLSVSFLTLLLGFLSFLLAHTIIWLFTSI